LLVASIALQTQALPVKAQPSTCSTVKPTTFVYKVSPYITYRNKDGSAMVIPKGGTIQVLKESGSYYQVKYKGKVGFIASNTFACS